MTDRKIEFASQTILSVGSFLNFRQKKFTQRREAAKGAQRKAKEKLCGNFASLRRLLLFGFGLGQGGECRTPALSS